MTRAPVSLPLLDPADPLATSGSRRWLLPWDVYVSIALVAVSVAVAAQGGTGVAARAVAVTCLLAILASWFGGARRLAGSDSRNGGHDTPAAIAYVAAATVVFAVAVAVDGMSTYALFALCPLAYLCLSLVPGIIAVSFLNLLPVPMAVLAGADAATIRVQSGIAVLGLVFSVLIGVSIDGLVRQSTERAELIIELEATRAELAAVSHEAGVSAERSRLASEIHDTLAQGFTSIVALVQAAESELDTDRAAADRHLALALRTARENLAEARAMVTALAPADLRAGTLADLVSGQVARLAEETGASTSCAVEGIPADLPTTFEVVLVRTLQESLANIRKHAAAHSVTVDLLGRDDAVTLTVSDDGVGFFPGGPTGESGGYGLKGLRARAEQVGGALTIRSAPGDGTTLQLELPR